MVFEIYCFCCILNTSIVTCDAIPVGTPKSLTLHLWLGGRWGVIQVMRVCVIASMALNSRLRTVGQWFTKCVRGCQKDHVKRDDTEKLKTTEAGEETADVSSTPEATHASTVQVVQPTKSRTGQSSPSARCLVHQYDTISEISSEELTEFGELLQVPEQVEETSQEVILTVPSIGCIETIPSVCENQRQAIHTVTETEILYSESEDLVRTNDSTEEIFVKTETQESLCSSSDQNTLSDNMEAVDTKTSGVTSGLDELSLKGEGQDVEEALNFDPSNFDPSSISSLVEQLQAPLDDDQREVSPENVDFQGTNGSLHASLKTNDLEAALAENFNGVDRESQDVEKSTGDEVKGDDSKVKKDKTKEEKKSKKKEDKTIDHILRALSSLHTTEEKLAALCKKYADLHEDHRILQATSKLNTRKLSVVSREKDQLQSEHTKAVMAKSKLESLCRELQKHNQVIRQESLQRAREEDEKRKEISNKFQTTITEIQQQMTDHHERNQKLRDENQELAGKLKKFIEQYELREKQVEKVMQHRELEQKLADAKLAQSNAILKEEQEKNKKERELLILQATEGQKKAALLEAQLAMYKERYEEFQSTINKSNEMFQKFKSEMDKMTKRIKKLEKDGAQWKQKWENSNKALIEMAEEKTHYDREKPLLMGKIKKLESLCRAMQAERLGRKVLEASSLDPSKFEETLAASQGIEKQIQTQINSSSAGRAWESSSPQVDGGLSSMGGARESPSQDADSSSVGGARDNPSQDGDSSSVGGARDNPSQDGDSSSVGGARESLSQDGDSSSVGGARDTPSQDGDSSSMGRARESPSPEGPEDTTDSPINLSDCDKENPSASQSDDSSRELPDPPSQSQEPTEPEPTTERQERPESSEDQLSAET